MKNLPSGSRNINTSMQCVPNWDDSRNRYFVSQNPPGRGGFVQMNIMDRNIRTLSPQESRVVLALAEEKRRDVGRAEIIELPGVKPKAADKVIESLRRKGWLERASWGEYIVIPPEQGPDALGESNLLALASRIADPYYIGYGSAAAHYGWPNSFFHLMTASAALSVLRSAIGTLASMIGEVIIVRVPLLDADGVMPAKLHGIEAQGIWIESQDFTNQLMEKFRFASSRTIPLVFVHLGRGATHPFVPCAHLSY